MRSAARRFGADAKMLRRWGRSPARTMGVLAASAAIVSAAVMAGGTELASSPNASANPATASATATVSGVADQTSASRYLDTINDVDKELESNLQSLASAVQNGDWNGARAACQRISGSGDAFKNTLPSPDSRVTPRIKQAADNIATAGGICMGFGPAMVQADWDNFMVSINNARSDLLSAVPILQHPR